MGRQCDATGRVSIGAAHDNDLVLTDEGVAQYHAMFRTTGTGASIADAGSGSGVFVLGKRIHEDLPLSHGCEVTCGTVVLRYIADAGFLDHELPWPHLNLGIACFLQGEHAQARESLNYARHLDPNSATVEWYSGCVERALGNRDAARTAFSTAARLDTGHHRANHALGIILMEMASDPGTCRSAEERTQHNAEAVDCISKATQIAPNTAEYLYDLARAHLECNEEQRALAAVRDAISVDGATARYHVLLSCLAQRLGNVALAREAGKKALALAPDDLEANRAYGDICFENGDFAEAAERLDFVRRSELQTGMQVVAVGSRFFYRLGRSLFELGRYVPASAALECAAGELRDAVFYGARCHARTGHDDSAIRIFQMALDQFGEDPKVRFYQASAHGRLGQYELGIEVLAPVEDDHEWSTRALCLGARLLAGSEKYEEADGKLAQARRHAPDSPEVFMESGRIAYVRGMHDEARADFETVLRLVPHDVDTTFWLGKNCFAQGRVEDSECFFREVVDACNKPSGDIQRTVAEAHDYLGRTALKRKQAKDAIRHFEEAKSLGLCCTGLDFDLALAYAACNEYGRSLAGFSSLAMGTDSSHEVNLNVAAISARMAQELVAKGELPEAVSLLEQSLALYRTEGDDAAAGEIRQSLAETLLRHGAEAVGSGQSAEGCRAISRAKDLTPLDTRGDFYLAAGQFALGKYEHARSLFAVVPHDDPNYQDATHGAAFTLERLGRLDEADCAWRTLLGEEWSNAEERTKTRIGLAGYLARRERWRDAAEILHGVLDAPGARTHRLYEQICLIVIAYLGLSGDDASMREVIDGHLTDASPEAADFYLGAVLAQQDKLEAAHQHLSRIATKKNVRGVDLGTLRDLFDAVCLALAARKAVAGDLRAAISQLAGVVDSKGERAQAARALRDSLETTVLLGSCGNDLGDATAEAYKGAFKRDPDNNDLLRNYAVVAHRLALLREGSGDYSSADQYWKLATALWTKLAGVNTKGAQDDHSNIDRFWQVFMTQYNEGRSPRDRLTTDDVVGVRTRLFDVCRALNVALARVHLGNRSLVNVRRHLKHALDWPYEKGYNEIMADSFLEAAKLELREAPAVLAELAEFLWGNVSKSAACRSVLLETSLVQGMEALWNARHDEFKSRMHSMENICDSSNGDLKSLARAAAQASVSFIKSVADLSRACLLPLRTQLGDARAKQILAQTVMQMCKLYDGLAAHQQMALDGTPSLLADIVMKVIVACISGN